jgi:hypothetical protein
VNEWVYDPKDKAREIKTDRGFSPFLEQFLESNYNAPKLA